MSDKHQILHLVWFPSKLHERRIDCGFIMISKYIHFSTSVCFPPLLCFTLSARKVTLEILL